MLQTNGIQYGGMDNKDHFVGLSLDIATANQKLHAATEYDRGDCLDRVTEGSSTEPAQLSLFPEGGAYVLTATTMKLTPDLSGTFIRTADFLSQLLLQISVMTMQIQIQIH